MSIKTISRRSFLLFLPAALPSALVQFPPTVPEPAEIPEPTWRVIVSGLIAAHSNTLIRHETLIQAIRKYIPDWDSYDDKVGKI